MRRESSRPVPTVVQVGVDGFVIAAEGYVAVEVEPGSHAPDQTDHTHLTRDHGEEAKEQLTFKRQQKQP